MLSAEQNELLTRVGPGSAMGQLLREYWLPAFRSSELPLPDGRPRRLRLLGEDLLGFRDSEGQVGVVSEYCLHRGASLYYGRNEECGLRCVYHGWKYDRAGHCVDMPNEPPRSRFKEHLALRTARVVERNGLIWVYLGEREDPGEPPKLEWSILPEAQVSLSKRFTRANWAQVLEGGIDSSHGQFLHRGTIARGDGRQQDTHPVYEVADTDYGSLIAARRDLADQPTRYFWRIYQFLMPFYTMVPGAPDRPIIGHAFVPRDDVSTMVWSAVWHPTRAIDHDTDLGPGSPLAIHVSDYQEPTDEADSEYLPRANRGNDYLADWERQQSSTFSGIPGIALQDAAMQESMGAIFNRQNEHLGSSDAAILHVRRRWMALAQALEGAEGPPELPGLARPESYLVRSCSLTLDKGEPWLEAAREHLQARPGVFSRPAST
ncbi:MAG: Rieske 2Fe-2S domain-containing protein [Acidimicrobiales bacterium]|nr:Rieske 2Fe-2S domain-containing protein [Acidimicrobiales bacterium]